MKNKIRAFLLADACLGLFLSIVAMSLVYYSVVELQKIKTTVEIKVDRKLAEKMMAETKITTVKLHNRTYGNI